MPGEFLPSSRTSIIANEGLLVGDWERIRLDSAAEESRGSVAIVAMAILLEFGVPCER